VTEGDSDGVSGVNRAQRVVDSEQGLDHAFHLSLVGSTPSGHRRLDLVGRVEGHRAAGGRPLGHNNARRVTSLHGCPSVDLEQDPFDGHLVGPVFGD
ncbi:uncharacterized protein METZ01_LOCUS132796, partial [marine metagenome]